LPPVRLFREGIEQQDVWAIVRNNIRCRRWSRWISAAWSPQQVAHDNCSSWLSRWDRSIPRYGAGLAGRTEVEMRRRIALLEDGEYALTTWTEWEASFSRFPAG